jgi:hypothetical protein
VGKILADAAWGKIRTEKQGENTNRETGNVKEKNKKKTLENEVKGEIYLHKKGKRGVRSKYRKIAGGENIIFRGVGWGGV